MPLHYHDFITPKSSGNAAIGKAVALGFLFLLVALGDDFFAQANTVGLEVEERAFRYGENLHRTHVTFRQAGIDLIAHIVQGVAIFELDVQVRQEAALVLIIRHDNKELVLDSLDVGIGHDVLQRLHHQVAAANAALNAFSKELLANHIRTCVAQDIRAGKDETIDELVTTLQKLMK